MIIKPATFADSERLYALVCEQRAEQMPKNIFDEYYIQALAQENRRIFLAHQDGQAIAYADAEVCPSLSECALVGVINDFFVCDAYRRNNVGSGLLLSVTTYFKSAGCIFARARCQKVNGRSQDFLEKRGFAKTQYAFVRDLRS